MNSTIDFDLDKAIVLADNEFIIDSYEGIVTINPVGKGYFVITNYRFIYLAVTKDKKSSSIAVTQTDIRNVSGVKSEIGKRANMIQKIIALVVFFAGILGFAFILRNVFSLGIGFGEQLPLLIICGILTIVGIFLLIFAKRKMFNLSILTNPKETFVSFTSSFFKSPNQGKIIIKPTSTTFTMIKEMGKAIINAQQIRQGRV